MYTAEITDPNTGDQVTVSAHTLPELDRLIDEVIDQAEDPTGEAVL